jgi:hypothetical protein
MKHQAGAVVPWWINRYIFQKKDCPSPTLYKFDTQGDESSYVHKVQNAKGDA